MTWDLALSDFRSSLAEGGSQPPRAASAILLLLLLESLGLRNSLGVGLDSNNSLATPRLSSLGDEREDFATTHALRLRSPM